MAASVREALRAKYARRGPAEDQVAILPRGQGGEAEGSDIGASSEQISPAGPLDKSESLGAQEAPERRKGRRKKRLKKYGKNVGKVLRKGCRYLVLGLQGLANAYSSPLGVAVSVAAAFR